MCEFKSDVLFFKGVMDLMCPNNQDVTLGTHQLKNPISLPCCSHIIWCRTCAGKVCSLILLNNSNILLIRPSCRTGRCALLAVGVQASL